MNKKLAWVLTCLITPLAFTSCKKDANKIVIAEVTRSIFYAPMYVAVNEGYFTEEGLNVSIITTPGADKTMAALLSKEAQIGLMGPEATVYVYNNGQKDYAVNFAQLTQKDGSFLVSKEYYDYETFDFDVLKGKSIIGGRKGGMPEMVLEYVLKSKGYDIGRDEEGHEITIRTDVSFDVMAGAFTAGNDEFVTLFEPSATQMEEIKEGYVVASIGEQGGNIPYTCFSSLKSYHQSNEKQLKAFTRAIKKGLEYVNTHSAKEIAAVIVNSFPTTNLSTMESVIARYQGINAWPDNLLLTEESFEKLQEIVMMAGELTQKAPYDKLVTAEYL